MVSPGRGASGGVEFVRGGSTRKGGGSRTSRIVKPVDRERSIIWESEDMTASIALRRRDETEGIGRGGENGAQTGMRRGRGALGGRKI